MFTQNLSSKCSQNTSADRRGAYHIARRPVVNCYNWKLAKLAKESINVQKTHSLSAGRPRRNGLYKRAFRSSLILTSNPLLLLSGKITRISLSLMREQLIYVSVNSKLDHPPGKPRGIFLKGRTPTARAQRKCETPTPGAEK